MKNKFALLLGIVAISIILQASSCTEQAMKSATNDGNKALVETKVTPIVRDFLNIVIGSSTTISGIVDFRDSGMGDVIHIDTFTVNVPLKFDIPIKATFPISIPIAINVPLGAVLLVTVIILFILFPYILVSWSWFKNKK